MTGGLLQGYSSRPNLVTFYDFVHVFIHVYARMCICVHLMCTRMGVNFTYTYLYIRSRVDVSYVYILYVHVRTRVHAYVCLYIRVRQHRCIHVRKFTYVYVCGYVCVTVSHKEKYGGILSNDVLFFDRVEVIYNPCTIHKQLMNIYSFWILYYVTFLMIIHSRENKPYVHYHQLYPVRRSV